MVGIRGMAPEDVRTFLEDKTHGNGWDFVLTAPDNTSAPLVGFSTDIYAPFEENDSITSLRTASITLSLLTLNELGFPALPEGIHDESQRPWVVDFKDPLGNDWKWKINESNPDRVVGIVVCMLEVYQQ